MGILQLTNVSKRDHHNHIFASKFIFRFSLQSSLSCGIAFQVPLCNCSLCERQHIPRGPGRKFVIIVIRQFLAQKRLLAPKCL